MSGEVEAIADVVTGGALASVVEPDHGAGSDTGATGCLNCGGVITARFCSNCGQRAQVHRSLAAFGQDILHSVLHFDGKIWNTLPLLAWRPGDLTRRYVHGERAKFISPLALFLFSVFLMFAVFGWAGLSIARFGDGIAKKAGPEAVAKIAKDTRETEAEIAKLKAERAALIAAGKRRDGIDGEIAGNIASLEGLKAAARFAKDDALTINIGPRENKGERVNALEQEVREAVKNPQLLAYKVQTSAYKYSWALIPLSVPFVWLLFFWRREFHLYDHAVFVTYSLCFMSLLVIVATIARALGVAEGLVLSLATLIPPIHMYRQLRKAYGLSRKSALIRAVLLTLFALFVISLFALMLIALGAVS